MNEEPSESPTGPVSEADQFLRNPRILKAIVLGAIAVESDVDQAVVRRAAAVLVFDLERLLLAARGEREIDWRVD